MIAVKAQPRASQAALRGIQNGALKVAVTVVPEKGKANDAIVAVLAKSLGLKRSQIELIAGATSTEKRFLLRGITAEELRRKL